MRTFALSVFVLISSCCSFATPLPSNSAFLDAPIKVRIPTYSIDVRFLTDHSILKGALDQNASYSTDEGKNADSEFAQEAMLDFGKHKVRVYLIASRHSDDNDTRFIRGSISTFSINPKKARLFIEGGDLFAKGGGATELITLIKRKSPSLETAIERDKYNPTSILNPAFLEHNPFTVTQREWVNESGDAVNFDLIGHFHENAFRFLFRNTLSTFALEFIRAMELPSDTLTFSEFQTFLPTVFPEEFTGPELSSFIDPVPNLPSRVNWYINHAQMVNLIRERYMRYVLYEKIKNGDVIVTHPVHMRHLLLPEQRPI